MSKIIVVGSMNMDLIVRTNEIPGLGETVLGNELLQIPGGKGANQGVAMAKLGRDIVFLGKVGEDNFGEELLRTMEEAGVDTRYIEKEKTSTGLAIINVDKEGNNNIIVIPGANGLVDKDYLKKNLDIFKESEVVVFQLEIPLDTVREGLKYAKALGKITVLNPAPAMELDNDMIENIDILIPNEHELERISKVKIVDEESIVEGSKLLLEKGIKQIIVTLGHRGVFYINRDEKKFFKAHKVKVVDTTGAGDSFIGGFVASYIENKDIEKSIAWGQRTAALCIQKLGAQNSLPSRREVEEFI